MSGRRLVGVLFLYLACAAVAACGTGASMSDDLVERHEDVSSKILSQRFANYGELTSYLHKSNVKYILEEDAIGKEPPSSTSISWDRSRNMRYLVLLPKSQGKLFRFRVYETDKGALHLESDFAYKNPYQ